MKRNEVNYDELSPMMQQYLDIKKDYEEELLFYRIGDFYELFFEDGETASRVLELTLTGKNAGLKERIPMCGVPFHSVRPYLEKLIEKGYKAAICEQLEDPKNTKGMVKRGVVQVITKGTLMDLEMMSPKDFNYIASVLDYGSTYVLTYSDISTGSLFVMQVKHDTDELLNQLINLGVKELVVSSDFSVGELVILKSHYGIEISTNDFFLTDEYLTLTEGIADKRMKSGVEHLLYYIVKKNLKDVSHLSCATVVESDFYMKLDRHTLRNLELFETLRLKERTYSLLWLLDQCKTSMGSRKIKNWLLQPLKDESLIQERYDLIDQVNAHYIERDALCEVLYQIYDIERLCAKVNSSSLNARDVLQIKNSIGLLPRFSELIHTIGFSYSVDCLEELYQLLDTAIVDTPPLTLKEGGLIRDGYHAQLDELRSIRSGGKAFVSSFEEKLRNETGIKNLKVGYNKVFGYYIEVTKGQAKNVMEEFGWERRQTLTGAERYISSELKEKEAMILNAEEKIYEIEYQLFMELKSKIQDKLLHLKKNAEVIACVDAIVSLARVAESYGLVRPTLTQDSRIEIVEGRHPVVEVVSKGSYVPNDCFMDEQSSTLLITGPNMSGKSTYMRQLAVIVIMAQIGSFVPAKSAVLPIVDQIFTRIGASDDLVSGESTFMVEMKEACYAISHATPRSLVLFDELGRGTATYDGMSLAQSILEYITKEVGCKTLFSTHYHELTRLEGEVPGISNIHVEAHEEHGNVTFLHKIAKGPIDKSYGIHVAKLAQMPTKVLKRAQDILKYYENHDTMDAVKQFSLFDMVPSVETDVSVPDPVIEEIASMELDHLRPVDALNELYRLQEEIRKKESKK